MKIFIKPLSVNKAWQGRRFKSYDYLVYIKDLKILLPKNIKVDDETPLKIEYTFGFSTTNADIDNCIKPLQDVLCQVYNFNDRYIEEINVKKVKVEKGKEFLDFNIITL